MRTLGELLQQVPQAGELRWIGVRPARRVAMISVTEAELRREAGLTGDHARPGARNARQVTLIQWEHFAVLAALLKRPVEPADVRRNLVIAGINLFSLKNRRFRIGSALLETTGWCQPCGHMEERLGPGAFQAMRGHGGLTARVLEGGILRIGDPVVVEP